MTSACVSILSHCDKSSNSLPTCAITARSSRPSRSNDWTARGSPVVFMEDDGFEWDDTKAAENLASHGVSFDAARLAFDDPFAVAREDRRQDYGEDRYILLGMV